MEESRFVVAWGMGELGKVELQLRHGEMDGSMIKLQTLNMYSFLYSNYTDKAINNEKES
jgi:hypothetical protein